MMEKNVQVAVRVRPMNEREKSSQRAGVVSAQPKANQITVKKKTYTFDRVFGQYATQKDVFKGVVQSAVDEALAGFNCTVFAYGQTGTGKTHTMQGTLSPNDENSGIIPRSVNYIFEKLQATKTEYSVRVSFLQLYNEECKDLLGENRKDKPLRLMEDIKRGGVYCQNLEEITTLTASHVFELLEVGVKNRISAETLLNDQSSRSHCIFTIRIHSKEANIGGEDILRSGTLNLVDLAGSECIGRSGARNARAREAGNINQSLLTLGRVITALVDKHPHVPYRDSKLTRLLQESLGGKAMTTIIATVGPGGDCVEETLSTLDYANRAKNIKNKPEANQRMTKHVLIKEYGQEIDALRAQLIAARNKDGIYLPAAQFSEMQERIAGLGTQLVELEEELERKGQQILELEDTLEMSKQENQETNQKLQETEAQWKNTKDELSQKENMLQDTNDKLQKTQASLSISQENEANLLADASTASKLYQNRVTEIRQLHSKIDRKENVLTQNDNLTKNFAENAQSECDRFGESLNSYKSMHQESIMSIHTTIESASTKFEDDLTMISNGVAGIKSSIENSLESILGELQQHSGFVAEKKELTVAKVDSESTKWIHHLKEVEPIIAMQTNQLQNMLKTLHQANAQVCVDIRNQLKQTSDSMENFVKEQAEQIDSIKNMLALALDDHGKQTSRENSQVIGALKATQDEFQNQIQSIQRLMQAQLDACVSSVVQSLTAQSTIMEQQVQDTKSRLENINHKMCSSLDDTLLSTKSQQTLLNKEIQNCRSHLEAFESKTDHGHKELDSTVEKNQSQLLKWNDSFGVALSQSADTLKTKATEDAETHTNHIARSRESISKSISKVLEQQDTFSVHMDQSTQAIHNACTESIPKIVGLEHSLKKHISISMDFVNAQGNALAEFTQNIQHDQPTGSTPTKEKSNQPFPRFEVKDISSHKRKQDDKENIGTSRIQPPKKYLKPSDGVIA